MPNQEVFAVSICWEGISGFFQWTVSGYVNHSPEVVGQQKTDSMFSSVLAFCFVLFLFSYWFSFSLVCLFFLKKMLLYLFLFFEREKEYKKEIEHRAGWVERWRGSRKSWKVGETMIKICHLKTVKQKSENFSAVGFFNNILFYFC